MRNARIVLALVLGLAFSMVPASLAQDAADTRRVQIELRDEGCPAGEGRFCVLPGTIEVNEGRTLLLEVTNAGQVRHNLTVAPGSPPVLADALDVAPLAPNGTTTVELPWETLSTAREEAGQRNLTLECGFDGHADLGEQLIIAVGQPAEEQPQPGFGLLAGLAALGVSAVLYRRIRR